MQSGKKKLLSVVVPVYNAENTLNRCIQSILGQSYTNFELILIDDGSTDSSLQICKQYTDSRVRIISISNSGVSHARNVGIDSSQGKLITFVDSDDYLRTDHFDNLIKGYSNDIQLSITGFQDIYSDDNQNCDTNYIIPIDADIAYRINFSQIELYDKLSDEHECVRGFPWNKMFLREIIINNNIRFNENLKMCEDEIFCAQYIEYVNKASFINRHSYCYVHRSGSLSNDMSSAAFGTVFKAYDLLLNIADGKGNGFLEKVMERYIKTLSWSFWNSNLYIARNEQMNDRDAFSVLWKNKRYLPKKHKIGLILIKFLPSYVRRKRENAS